jgi:hypothetical protein
MKKEIKMSNRYYVAVIIIAGVIMNCTNNTPVSVQKYDEIIIVGEVYKTFSPSSDSLLPFAGANVNIFKPESTIYSIPEYTTQTDSLGFYTERVKPGQYSIHYFCVGFIDRSVDLVVKDDQRIQIIPRIIIRQSMIQ